MILAQETVEIDWLTLIGTNLAIFAAAGAAVFLGFRPLRSIVVQRERRYDSVLRGTMMSSIQPRMVTVFGVMVMVMLGAAAYVISGNVYIAVVASATGALVPGALIKIRLRHRLAKLEDQLVGGVQILASGVRAGLNLVQAMQMVARDSAPPLRHEFAHLMQEYEYGVPLEEAMNKAALRIGSSDYRLLFAALETHRERGGDLGETLDRITASIREIQRLEKRVQTLTAQGRATARWLGAMPPVVMLIMYFQVDSGGVNMLFQDDLGKLILLVIAVMNIVGFLWIKKIMSIDI